MSTRERYVAEHTVIAGTIRNPGKFQGAPIWLPYFWDLALDGNGTTRDVDDVPVTTFMVQSGDVHEFPELAEIAPDQQIAISVWECESGFVRYDVTRGPDECAVCSKRFTATKRFKCAVCRDCKGKS